VCGCYSSLISNYSGCQI